jgi:anti-sigma-K factor RskA
MSDRELAAEFVLGAAEGRRLAEAERRLRAEPAFRAEVEAMRAMTGRLGELPADAWPEPREAGAGAPGRDTESRWRRRGRAWRPALALASLLTALAVGIGIGELLAGGSERVAPAAALSLQPLRPGSAAHGSVHMPAPGTMVLDVSGLRPAGPGHYYELWLMTSPSRTVPVASFSVNRKGHAEVRVPLPAAPAAYRYFDVSRQAAGAGTAHSGESVLRGPTT